MGGLLAPDDLVDIFESRCRTLLSHLSGNVLSHVMTDRRFHFLIKGMESRGPDLTPWARSPRRCAISRNVASETGGPRGCKF